MAQIIKIAQWNANGVTQHKNELEVFLKLNQIDILLISESHFTNSSYFRILNYNTYNTNHPDGRGHGGSAILIKNNLKHHVLPPFQKEYLQATIIAIETKLFNISIVATYCPPKHKILFNEFNEFFSVLGDKFIIGGDFNCKHTDWGSRLTTAKGKELLSSINYNNAIHLSTGCPTYWPTDFNKTPDLLDFFIVKGIPSKYFKTAANYDLSSDHSPIFLTFSTYPVPLNYSTKLHNQYTNWLIFQNIIDHKLTLHRPDSPTKIEDHIISFNNTIITATSQATPKNQIRKDNSNIPSEIKRLIALKRKARRTWHRSHLPSDKTIFNRTSNLLKQKLKSWRDESFASYVSQLNRFDSSIWKPIKNKRKPTQFNFPLKIINENIWTWAKSDQEKCEAFAEHLAQVYNEHDNTQDNNNSHLNQTPKQILEINPISPKEIREEIARLKMKSAPGSDQVTPLMLRNLSTKGILFLCNIFNAIIQFNYWPNIWKIAKMIVIPKPKKDLTNLSSYRPISLLSCVSKILERLILHRITSDYEEFSWLPNHQFGFRRDHSTIQQCNRLTNSILEGLNKKQHNIAVFLDVHQAFDKVWHYGLLQKIKQTFPKYHEILKSYLNNRKFYITINNNTSDTKPIHCGVPQGSVLSPLLFNLYTSDMPINSTITTCTYADDIAIVANHVDINLANNNLQNYLTQLEIWFKNCKMKINIDKSHHLIVSLRPHDNPPLFLFNNPIPIKDEVKYLGLHLDNKLIWKKHILKKKKQIELKMKELNWLLGRSSKLSLENKILLYKTIIIPIWTYGIELWGCASKSNIQIIQRTQNKILRTITNAPWYIPNYMLHNDLNIQPIQDIIRSKSTNYCTKIESQTNPTISEIPKPIRRLKRKWPCDLKH
uniref:Putative rna-directed dna polymerase from mobile element jockey n=1 Tax=Xenopsylla cheopis TaxID=163159 RepID=A0A6M2DDB3_XENCH